MRRLVLILAGLLLLMAAIVGIARSAVPPKVRYLSIKFYDPFYIAYERGLFAKHGIRVTLEFTHAGGPTVVAAIAGGSADVGTVAIPALINATVAGLPVVGFADVQSILPGQPLLAFFVRNDSLVKTPADAYGRIWAVNTSGAAFHYLAILALKQWNVDPAEVNFVTLPFDAQVLALEHGTVDIIGLPEPFATYAGQRGFRRLITALDIVGPKQVTLYAARPDFDKKTLAKFVGAVNEAVLWSYKNPQEAAKIVSKYTGVRAEDIVIVRFQPAMRVMVDDCLWWANLLGKKVLPCTDRVRP